MTYTAWVTSHAAKHASIMAKMTHLSDNEVIEYFRFENMVIHENDFCPLYAENRKCHEIEELNCYLCACPHFRFDDNGLETVGGRTLYSICSIDSVDGDRYIDDSVIHQDCSRCLIPHSERYIAKVFDRSWFALMKKASFAAL